MKTMRPLLLALLWCHSALVMSCVTLPDATPTMGVSQRLDSVMNVFVDRTGFNGVVLVSDAGKVVYQKAFGYANMEWKVANTTDTRFKLASLGKQFTALVILQLVKAGKLKLDDVMTKYVPEVSAKNADRITIRELLNHTSGIPNYHAIPDFDEAVAKRSLSRTQFLDLFKDKDLLFEPGTRFQYTNLGYFLLGLIAERVSGRSYGALLREKVLRPAHMSDTFLEDTSAVMARSANGYENAYTHFIPARYRDPSSVFAAGNIASTAMDLFRYDQALRSAVLLDSVHQRWMYTPGLDEYGLGWMITRYPVPGQDSVTLVYHDGGTSGAASVMYRFLENDRCVVVLSNVSPYDCYPIARGLSRVLHGRPYDLPKRSLVERFARTLEERNTDAAVNEFRTLKAKETEYELDGVAFNQLGYQYLRKNRLEEAVAVFQLNVEAFPQVADPYDSLAEGYMRQGRSELAITNYRRSLELDPNNSNAAAMLKKLTASSTEH
jgi:CubicO group peptidase (beta-lactamase class C family)